MSFLPQKVPKSNKGSHSYMQLPILLFDPDPVAARVLAMQLRHAGFATLNGAAAISNARSGEFVSIVVIADLADSQMRHCLHQIREAYTKAWLLIIFDPTSNRDENSVCELADVTMDVPFTVTDLAQRLDLLSRRVRPEV
jgi:DNA-binding response OmpR family regulator